MEIDVGEKEPCVVARRVHEEAAAREAQFPRGVEAQPFDEAAAAALLSECAEWGSDLASFLQEHFPAEESRRTFAQLRVAAEVCYAASFPEAWCFPLVAFNDSLRAAYCCGLLALDYQSPTGNPDSRDRVACYLLTNRGRELLGSSDVPGLCEERLPSAQEEIAIELVRIVQEHGERSTMCVDDLFEVYAENIPDADLDRARDVFDAVLSRCVAQGLVTRGEDALGAETLTMTDAAMALADRRGSMAAL